MKIALLVGTRPEIIKMSPIIRCLEKEGLSYFLVHTGQHYSVLMDEVFFDELHLPIARYNLGVGSGSHGWQTGRILIEVEEILLKEMPDVVLVQGDTNSVLAGTIAASKLHLKVGHIEAGLRSYDKNMPEELNRILADHSSDYLFAPTKSAVNVLLREGIPQENVFLTGNTIVDALLQNVEIAKARCNVLEKLGLDQKGYFLVTVHRPENVDNKVRLKSILKALQMLYDSFHLPIVFPVHPRTFKMLNTYKLNIPNCVVTIQPMGYLEFIQLEAHAALILTDSGGIQEEACILTVPCVTLRENTERPETVEVGANIITGVASSQVLRSVDEMLRKSKLWPNPFGDGKSAERIIRIITFKHRTYEQRSSADSLDTLSSIVRKNRTSFSNHNSGSIDL